MCIHLQEAVYIEDVFVKGGNRQDGDLSGQSSGELLEDILVSLGESAVAIEVFHESSGHRGGESPFLAEVGDVRIQGSLPVVG